MTSPSNTLDAKTRIFANCVESAKGSTSIRSFALVSFSPDLLFYWQTSDVGNLFLEKRGCSARRVLIAIR